ncbi:MAG: arginine--tRNA ligase [Candidatus Vecturithrix sp.]|jgi:arginyl-tRNA synthetase|nr:arginine--tRNA ligase [Candidatus Vecturithrix sp.]
MKSLKHQLTDIVADAFATQGFERKYGIVETSNRTDLGQFQCNGALAAAKQYNMSPRQLAQQVVDCLQQNSIFSAISLAGPGFINLTVTDEFLARHLQQMKADRRLGAEEAVPALKIIVDYGGANIAKPLHVGHLRAAIIGESLKRLARFLGHDVLGDVHLGDWGLQMGMIISELARRHPELSYFDPAYSGDYPQDAPFTIADLEEIYPTVSARAKNDPAIMEAARQATYELQQGHRGYRALWQHIFNVSVADLKADYHALNIDFDLWYGESHTQDRLPGLIERLQREGWAYESKGALVVDVTQPEDTKNLPPLMLVKSDGAVLYGTTDLATIEQRVEDYHSDLMLYVVDKRQSDHFRQVFRGAHKTGIAPESLQMIHLGFGTMNGKDGKPFKTRAGGVMKLKDLIQMITDKALERMTAADIAKEYEENERQEIARIIGVATLKFADLMNHYTTDYIFDLDRFASFDGRTGPYLLYTAVRIKSILRKAAEQGLQPGNILPPVSQVERDVFLKLADFPNALDLAFENYAPNYLCDYAYTLASLFTTFYHEHHILRETNPDRQASWLGLAQISLAILEQVLDLLGIEVPERM